MVFSSRLASKYAIFFVVAVLDLILHAVRFRRSKLPSRHVMLSQSFLRQVANVISTGCSYAFAS